MQMAGEFDDCPFRCAWFPNQDSTPTSRHRPISTIQTPSCTVILVMKPALLKKPSPRQTGCFSHDEHIN
jgi:hypothetical protein